MAQSSIHEFKEGAEFFHSLKITSDLMHSFASISGDTNHLHTEEGYAKDLGFEGKVAYGNLLGLMISHLVGMKLPTHRVMLIQQQVDYKKPVYIDQTISLIGSVTRIQEALNVVEIGLLFKNENDTVVCKGKCLIKCI